MFKYSTRWPICSLLNMYLKPGIRTDPSAIFARSAASPHALIRDPGSFGPYGFLKSLTLGSWQAAQRWNSRRPCSAVSVRVGGMTTCVS